MQNNERIVQLLYRRLKGMPLTTAENEELEAWLSRSEWNRSMVENLTDEDWLREARKRYHAPGKEAGLAQLREALFKEKPAARTYSLVRRLAVAASVLIIITSGIYFLGRNNASAEVSQVALAVLNNQLEILPGGEAILTLSNGNKIPLRSTADGLLATLSDGRQLHKQDGKLVYQSAEPQSAAGEVDYSSAPRSDQYSVVLPDGSRVWLNRGSTLIYPEKFSDDRRTVELTGEGYFEIAKAYAANGRDRLPFIVKIPAQSKSIRPCEVEVLGTHFNIYAHSGEPVKTTLTKGKVKMSRGKAARVLKPGQQAVADTALDEITVRDSVNMASVLAWKENKFVYEQESLRSVLLELKRWYGFGLVTDPAAEMKVAGNITFKYDRKKPLSEVINQLNTNCPVRLSLQGNHVYVNP